MKNKNLILVLALVAVLFFLYVKNKNKKQCKDKECKKAQATNNGGFSTDGADVSKVKEPANVSVEDLYNPCYVVADVRDGENPSVLESADPYTSELSCSITKGSIKKTYKITKARAEEIIHNVEKFVSDICNAPNGFMQGYIKFFSECTKEELSFAENYLELAGYVIVDKNGDAYILESFAEVLNDPVQNQRQGITEFKKIFSNE